MNELGPSHSGPRNTCPAVDNSTRQPIAPSPSYAAPLPPRSPPLPPLDDYFVPVKRGKSLAAGSRFSADITRIPDRPCQMLWERATSLADSSCVTRRARHLVLSALARVRVSADTHISRFGHWLPFCMFLYFSFVLNSSFRSLTPL